MPRTIRSKGVVLPTVIVTGDETALINFTPDSGDPKWMQDVTLCFTVKIKK